jgi:flagellar biosynthesis anti-sigma factor FlgM
MKINDYIGPGATEKPGEAGGVRPDVTRGRGPHQDAAGQDDKVSLSDRARVLSSARRELGDVNAIRTDKVEELRGKIERGEYRPDLRAVARKLLEAIFGERNG